MSNAAYPTEERFQPMPPGEKGTRETRPRRLEFTDSACHSRSGKGMCHPLVHPTGLLQTIPRFMNVSRNFQAFLYDITKMNPPKS